MEKIFYKQWWGLFLGLAFSTALFPADLIVKMGRSPIPDFNIPGSIDVSLYHYETDTKIDSAEISWGGKHRFTDLKMGNHYQVSVKEFIDNSGAAPVTYYPHYIRPKQDSYLPQQTSRGMPILIFSEQLSYVQIDYEENTSQLRFLLPEKPYPNAPDKQVISIDHSGKHFATGVTSWEVPYTITGDYTTGRFTFSALPAHDREGNLVYPTFTPSHLTHVAAGEKIDIKVDYLPFRYKVIGYFDNSAQWRGSSLGYPNPGQHFPHHIDPSKLTHVSYRYAGFGFITEEFEDGPRFSNDYKVYPLSRADIESVWDEKPMYEQVQTLKEINPDLKTILAIGGQHLFDPRETAAASMSFPAHTLFREMISTENARSEFIDSAIDFAREHGFDGIELHWPTLGVAFPHEDERQACQDFAHFSKLLQEFHLAIYQESSHLEEAPLFLMLATPAQIPNRICQRYRYPVTYFGAMRKWAPFVEAFNIQAFDYYNHNDSYTGHTAPLENNAGHDIYTTLENYITLGAIPREKLILGLSASANTFGGVENLFPSNHASGKLHDGQGAPPGAYSEQRGYLTYYEVIQQLAAGYYDAKHYEPPEALPYAYRIGNTTAENEWVSFEDVHSIRSKLEKFVLGENSLHGPLQGALLATLSDDDFSSHADYPLLTEIDKVLYHEFNTHPVYMNFINDGDYYDSLPITFYLYFDETASPIKIDSLAPQSSSRLSDDEIPLKHYSVSIYANYDRNEKYRCKIDAEFSTLQFWEIIADHRRSDADFKCNIKLSNRGYYE